MKQTGIIRYRTNSTDSTDSFAKYDYKDIDKQDDDFLGNHSPYYSSEDESISTFDYVSDSDDDSNTLGPMKSQEKAIFRRRVRFGTVTVREYAVTFGRLAALEDVFCPLQLGWEHTDDKTIMLCIVDNHTKQVKRLTMQDRIERIAKVQGYNICEGCEIMPILPTAAKIIIPVV